MPSSIRGGVLSKLAVAGPNVEEISRDSRELTNAGRQTARRSPLFLIYFVSALHPGPQHRPGSCAGLPRDDLAVNDGHQRRHCLNGESGGELRRAAAQRLAEQQIELYLTEEAGATCPTAGISAINGTATQKKIAIREMAPTRHSGVVSRPSMARSVRMSSTPPGISRNAVRKTTLVGAARRRPASPAPRRRPVGPVKR